MTYSDSWIFWDKRSPAELPIHIVDLALALHTHLLSHAFSFSLTHTPPPTHIHTLTHTHTHSLTQASEIRERRHGGFEVIVRDISRRYIGCGGRALGEVAEHHAEAKRKRAAGPSYGCDDDARTSNHICRRVCHVSSANSEIKDQIQK